MGLAAGLRAGIPVVVVVAADRLRFCRRPGAKVCSGVRAPVVGGSARPLWQQVEKASVQPSALSGGRDACCREAVPWPGVLCRSVALQVDVFETLADDVPLFGGVAQGGCPRASGLERGHFTWHRRHRAVPLGPSVAIAVDIQGPECDSEPQQDVLARGRCGALEAAWAVAVVGSCFGRFGCRQGRLRANTKSWDRFFRTAEPQNGNPQEDGRRGQANDARRDDGRAETLCGRVGGC